MKTLLVSSNSPAGCRARFPRPASHHAQTRLRAEAAQRTSVRARQADEAAASRRSPPTTVREKAELSATFGVGRLHFTATTGFKVRQRACDQRGCGCKPACMRLFEFEFGNQRMSLRSSAAGYRVHLRSPGRGAGAQAAPCQSQVRIAIRRAPGPGSPVAPTCDGGAVNEHRQSGRNPPSGRVNFGVRSKPWLPALLSNRMTMKRTGVLFGETNMQWFGQIALMLWPACRAGMRWHSHARRRAVRRVHRRACAKLQPTAPRDYRGPFKVYTQACTEPAKAQTLRRSADGAGRQAHQHHHMLARDYLQRASVCFRAPWKTTWTRLCFEAGAGRGCA